MYCFPICEIQVRNEPAENFLSLIKEWEKLCEEFVFKPPESAESDVDDDEEPENQSDSEEFEVEKFLSICYGDPNEAKKPGLYFKVCLLQTCILT
jgi:DNA (cytosine-5)-methyltransferase 1